MEVHMNESFETIVNYTHGKLELIEQELKRSNALNFHRSPFHVKVLITDLVTTVECCKAMPIFNNLNHLSKDEVLSYLCVIRDSFRRLDDVYYNHIWQIACKRENSWIVYDLISDITFDILLHLSTKYEEYVEEWNKL